MTNEDPADEVEVSKPKFSFEERVRSQQHNMASLPVAEQRAAKSKTVVARKPVDGYAQALRWTLVATAVIAAAVITLAYRTGVAATQVALVAGPEEVSYLSSWLALAATPAPEVAARAAWLRGWLGSWQVG